MSRSIKLRRVVATTLTVAATAVALPATSLAGDGGGGPHPTVAQK